MAEQATVVGLDLPITSRVIVKIVGHMLVDARTGEVTVADGQTSEDLLARAEALYERATL
jgi:hypothetical protein